MVDKIAEIQQRKELFLRLSLTVQSLDHKYHRYTDIDVLKDICSGLADQILSKSTVPEVDTSTFWIEEALPILEEFGKRAVTLTNVQSGYKTQGPIDKYLSTDRCTFKSVAFKDSDLSYLDYNTPAKYQNLSILSFENSTLSGHIGHDLPKGNLEELSFNRCRMDRFMRYDETEAERTTIGSNAVEVASKNPFLKRFYMNEMSLLSGDPKKEAGLEWHTLPDTLEYLSLAKTDIMNANFDGLMDYVHSAKNLKVVDLASCGLTDEHAAKLTKALDGTKIGLVNLSGNSFSEQGRNRLSALLDKSVMLAPHYEYLDKSKTLEGLAANRPIEDHLKQASSKADMIKQELLFPAARAGVFSSILDAIRKNKEEMTAKDYLAVDKHDKILIHELAATKQLPVVFSAENWSNTKQMQAVWDAVPDAEKSQLDGKDGRPSFQKMKNQVMANAVKVAVAGRMKQGR